MRCALEAAILLCSTAFSGDAGRTAVKDQEDPVRARLEAAKATYRTSVEKTKKDVASKLQAEIDEARKKGDRETLLRASKEKDDLEEKGTLPESVSVEKSRETLREANKALEEVFQTAVKKYTQADQDSKAKHLETEKQAFLKEFGALATIGAESEKEKKDKKATRGKSGREEPDKHELDPWGRWSRFPGDGLGPRFILWQDERGWHVRTITNKNLRQFDGAIQVVEGKLTSLTGTDGLELRGKTKDAVGWNEDRDRIAFKFHSTNNEDGFDFQVTRGTPKLRCAVKLDGYDHPESIFVGNQGQHPKEAKFTLEVKEAPAREKKS